MRLVGFTFRKTNSGRNIICEKPHLVSLRSKYLRELRCRREEGYDIVYLDESWINAHHTFEKEWQSVDGTVKRNIPSSKGQRLILAHAGNKQEGLVEGAGLVFQSISTDDRDYHSEMNGDIFKNWMEKTLFPSLKGPSCLVMDNASYHDDKIPTSSNTVAQIKNWLKRERINFNNKCLKPELLQLVKEQNKPKVFLIDKIIAQNGHTSLRLPPYHSHLSLYGLR